MPIALTPLPYAEDALAPHISADTVAVHHGKHHKGYVDKVNKAIAGTEHDDAPLEAIIRAAKASGDTALFNNAAQAWNHGFYWHSLSPDGGGAPTGDLANAIERSFGSFDAMKDELAKAAEGHFASGWAWLVARGDTIAVTDTHDAGTAVTDNGRPLLVIDVWEHAYYLDRKNERPKYVAAALDALINWDFAAENYARAQQWTYG